MLLSGSHRARLLASTALCAAGLALAPGSGAQANPREGTVAAGQATIQHTAPNRVDIIQRSDRAVIDWKQFSIGQGEHTHFEQPGAGSVTLNRVTGADASKIDGKLTATGNVYLVNPNGVMFGPTARVDVGGLVATTADIRNDSFMAGRDRFDQPSPKADARVENAGTITVKDGGLAALVAPGVENKGVIQARLGRVAIAGADRFAVDLNGDGLLSFEVGPAPAGAKVTHSGTIKADGGTVLLTAEAARGVVDNVVNSSGVIEARAVSAKGGTVVLSGGGGGVTVSGSIDASGAGQAQGGGTVKVLGDRIAIEAGARLDASGPNGGGTVLVGGNWQGQGPEQNASQTTVAKDATILAESERGPGGKVVAWADKKTRIDGKIRAKRGKVETSGKETLAIGAGASVEAAEWLLDPRNVTIANATANFDTATFAPTGDDATVDAATITGALNGGANVTVTTGADGTQAGDITVAAALSWTTAKTLTLNAANNVAVNAAIDASNNSSGFSIIAGGGISQTAAIDVNGTTTLNAVGAIALTHADNSFGTLSITKGTSADIFGSGNLEIGGVSNLTGALTLGSTGNITQSGAIGAGGLVTVGTASNKNVSLDGFANGIGSFAVTGGKDVALKTSGAVALAGTSIDGNLTVTSGGHITQTGALTLASGGVTAAVTAAESDIRLDTQANSIRDGLTLTGTRTNIRDLGLRNIRADAAVPSLAGLSLRNLTLAFDTAAITLNGFSLTGALSVTSGGTIEVSATGDLMLAGASTTAGASFETTGGTITDTGTGTLTIGGQAAFTTVFTGGKAITLDDAGHSFGSLLARVFDANAESQNAPISIAMSSGTVLSTLRTASDATIIAGGAITDAGLLMIGGAAGFTTLNDSGATITLDQAGNSFGSLSLRARNAADTANAGGSLSVTYGSGLTLAGLATAADASVIAGGPIGQSAAFAVGGLASFQTRDDTGAAITLAQAGNGFGSLSARTLDASGATATAGAIQIASAGNLDLARIETTASASIVADGVLTDSGALTVGAAASFVTRSDSGAAITLDNAGHGFGDLTARVLSANGSAVTAAPITIAHGGGLALTALQTGGAATISATGTIADTGTLSIGGAASFTTLNDSGATIVLDASGNSFGGLSLRTLNGAGSETRGAAVSAAVSGGLALGTIQTGGDATLAAGDAITDSGTLSIGGTASFTTLNDAGAAITLDSSGSSFGSLFLRARNAADSANADGAITLSMAQAVALGALETGAGASLTTGGLTQAAPFHVGGTLTLGGFAANADIDLRESGNSFGGLGFAGAAGSIRDLKLRHDGALALAGLSGLTGLRDLDLQLDGAAIALPMLSVSRDLTLNAGSDVTQSGRVLASGGTTDITTSGSITLDSTSNNFGTLRLAGTAATIVDASTLTIDAAALSGSLAATAVSGNVSVQAGGALDLARLSSQGGATVTASGAITDSGTLNVTGAATFTTLNDGGADITLNHAGNSFGSLALRSRDAGNTAARDGTLTLSLAGGLNLTGLETTGDANVTTSGQITQGGAAIVGGTATFALGAGNDALLTNTGNDFGTARFVSVRDVQLFDLDGLTLGASTVSGALSVTARDAIGQSGALSVTGAASFVTRNDSGAAIALNTAGNSFGRATLRSRNAGDTAARGGALALSDSGGLELAGLETTGNASIATTGALTQSGAILVGGTATFTLGGGDATLLRTDNDFGTVSFVSARNVQLFDLDNIAFGTSTLTGALSVTARDAITQSGGISVGSGGASFVTLKDGGAAITLDNAGNSIGKVTLRARNAADTGNANGAINFRTSGALDIVQLDTGAAAGLTAGGAIANSGLLTVGGALSLKTRTAAGAGISIDGANNSFASFSAQVRDSADSDDRTADIFLRRTGFFAPAIQLGGIRTDGNLTVISTGSLTQSAAAFVGGTASVEFSTFFQNASLDQAGNDFGKLRVSNAINATLTDVNGVELLASNVLGNLTLRAGGAVTQTGALSVGGALSLAATAANVDYRLDTLANQIDGGVSFGGTLGNVRDVLLRNTSTNATAPVLSGLTSLRDLTLAFDNQHVLLRGANIGRDLRVTTGRSIGQLEAVRVAGSTILSAGNGFAVQLLDGGNDFNSVQLTSGGNLILRDATAITLAGVNANGYLTVTAGGAIADSATISVAGAVDLKTLSDAGANIRLEQAANSYGQLTVRSRNAADTATAGGDITVNKTGALTLAGLETTGDVGISLNGALSQTSAVTVGGTATIDVGGSNISLGNGGNDFGTLRLTAGSAMVADLNGVQFGTSSLTGDLDLIAIGAVGQSGTLSVRGRADLFVGANDITLANAGNNFGSIAVRSARDATLRDSDALEIAGATLTGRLSLTAGGAISQSATISAAELAVAATGNAVNLGLTGNQVATVQGITGAGISFATTGALDVAGAVTSTGGNLIDLRAGGPLALAAAVNAGTTGSIALAGTSIAQSGTGLLTAGTLSGQSAGSVTLGLGNTVGKLGAFGAGGGFTFRTTGALQITGPLTAAAGDVSLTTGGALTQATAGAITAGGLALASTGAIDLGTADNRIGRVLGATGTSFSLRDTAGGLSIDGTVNASTGAVAVTTMGGGLTANADVTGTGVALRGTGLDLTAGTVNARGGLLTLDAGAGDLVLAAGAAARTTGMATLTAGGSAQLLGDIAIGGRLDGTVGGDAQFSGAGNLIGGFGAFAVGGRLDLVNAGNDFVVSGAVSAGQSLSLRMTAPTARLSVAAGGSLAAGGGGDLLLEADRIELGGTVAGTGTLFLRPRTPTRSIGVGDDAAGGLQLSAASVANLADGFGLIELGREDYAGIIELGTASFKDSLVVRAPQMGAAIHVVGQLHVAGNLTLFGPGASTTLDGALTTDGGAVSINDRLHVGDAGTIDTTGGGSFMGGGNVTLNGPVDGTTAYAGQLTIDAGTNGNLNFLGAVGMDTPLGTVLVPSANSFTADQQFVAAVLDVGSSSVFASNVNIRDSMIVRGTGGSADITGTVAGLSNEFAANLVQRPDGPADTYVINGCIMGTLCGVDPNFFVNFELMRATRVSAPEIAIVTEDVDSTFAVQRFAEMPRSTELVGSRDQEPGSIAPAAGGAGGFGGGIRSPALLPPVDPSSIQYSSVGDWELW